MTINIYIENHSATAILPSDFCHPQIANERFYGGEVYSLNGKIGLKFYNYVDGKRANLFLGAERFQDKYWGNGKDNTFHVFDDDEDKVKHIQLISDKMYSMAKLAGKPEEK